MSDYKNTLHLPQTDFEMRAGLARKEPIFLKKWQDEDLYGQIRRARATSPRFVLHDGPPYANGDVHYGHVLNKTLKDIVLKERTMSGFDAPYIPGWDCHGLPIEVQVDKELGARKGEMSKAELHQAYRDYAARFVDKQRQTFVRLGGLGRWDKPYLTMNAAYEGAILSEFANMVEQGLVYKGLRPVQWCVQHQTALAEAEVEYEDHQSPSAFVAFTAVAETARLQAVGLPADFDFVIWTTTPWTLPGNVAIAVHPDLEYVLYPVDGRLRLVARERLAPFLKSIDAPPLEAEKIQGTWQGRALEGLAYTHPLLTRTSHIVLGEHVTTEAGTGCVHTAPGHGAEDFEMARKYKLPILGVVDPRGVLNAEAGPYQGLALAAANKQILADLLDKKVLLGPQDARIKHRYAHCWRCHKPLVTRATEQWWVAMDKAFGNGPSLRQRALEAIDTVTWIPRWGVQRIRGMLENRPDWCLSRQRVWGVPIAVVYCEMCQTPHIEPDQIRNVAKVFAKQGASVWFEQSVQALYGDIQCEKCGGKTFRKETDILDVWFDSGVSFAAVAEAEQLASLKDDVLVDLYLEGSDQHRGWFHSSLLCALATRQRAPYRAILTHGFVVDSSGKKLSKSKGNYKPPETAIEKDGAELLRLWTAYEDYRDDIRLSQEIFNRLADSYRKIRNTIRYMLGNLFDFDPNQDLVSVDDLLDVDKYALSMADIAIDKIKKNYESYAFHTVMQTLIELCTVDLSAFYLDMLKDRLYASAADSQERRSAQTVLYLLARDLLRLMAPIFCFTAEEAWQFLPRHAEDTHSVHLSLFPGVSGADPKAIEQIRHSIAQVCPDMLQKFGQVREIRRVVNTALEQARRDKIIGSSTEAQVLLQASADVMRPLLVHTEALWADMLIVSKVCLQPGDADLTVQIAKADGIKCQRCWLYRVEVGQSTQHSDLCLRCQKSLTR